MTSHNRLDGSLRWRTVGRRKVDHSQEEGARWLQEAPKVIFRLCNQFQKTGTITRKFSQGPHRAITPAHDRYLTLSARLHQRTMAPQLSRDLTVSEKKFPGKQSTDGLTIYPVSRRMCLFDCI
ncbi:hypothetical protein TNCV_876521 [Trichonephila clavipes]|nr:hypothetical protein TNCV_876521 [Trichonephila clavipes]